MRSNDGGAPFPSTTPLRGRSPSPSKLGEDLPHPHPLLRRQVELVARFHSERRIPAIDIAHGQRTEHARRVAIGEPIRPRSASSRILLAQPWAKAMKKRWSPVKPSITGAALPFKDA